MAYLPIITVPYEGGPYRLGRRTDAPIRIYPDRWIADDIIASYGLSKWRERLSRSEFRRIKRAAKTNDGTRHD